MIVNSRHVGYYHGSFEFGVLVGQMSKANCVSLVGLAESGTLKFHGNPMWNSPAEGVVGRLHEQGIVELIFD